MTLADMIAQENALIQSWILWLTFINLLSVVFIIAHHEARWILGVFLANMVFMGLLYQLFGYVRLLGLSHIIFWTPLVIYLLLKMPQRRLKNASGVYLVLLLASNSLSLIFDYRDFFLWLGGDRAPIL